MRRTLIIFFIALMILVKMLIPANALLQQKMLDFLGMDRETVQAVGRCLYESKP